MDNLKQTPQIQPNSKSTPKSQKDFLTHLEVYLAKRDGVDKLLKISRYASKIILASSFIEQKNHFSDNLKNFESSVGLSRKAFRLGKFIQNINSLRGLEPDFNKDLIFNVVAYGSEGVYYFLEQFVWLAKSGLIDKKYLANLTKFSAWFEFVGYIGSVSLKVKDLIKIEVDEKCLVESIEGLKGEGEGKGGGEVEKLRNVREKKLMKRLSIVQDLADGLMALVDISGGLGRFSTPLMVSSAGLLSAVISTHKNWVSC
ncbi:hypothetical protein LIER_21006 [Lithospermum erythrorhizon]|uniref:Peroxisomal membrane protein 11A n=1 Tax=Lithospermum erythrorhizon TaxID=34254 RepID=A0AAV3QS15_LITER